MAKKDARLPILLELFLIGIHRYMSAKLQKVRNFFEAVEDLSTNLKGSIKISEATGC